MRARERWTETWARLTAPRRSGPILLVGLPLLSAQLVYTGTVDALLVGLVMVGGFLLAGPAGWRVLVSQGEAGRVSPAGALAFAGLGAGVVGLSGVALPVGMGLPPTFFTDPSSLAIMLALFWVGGWGLGRDIDLEINLERERARVADLARERERAELLAVRSHLDPHFLFNSLNAIAEWCNEDPAVAEEALLRLATMLRTVLHGVQAATWPLSRELALVDDLIAMHEVRDPTRFSVERAGWSSCPDLPVPPLLLLPVVENAMKHGPAAGHRGPVRIGVEARADRCVIHVENPGPYTGPRPGGHGVSMVQRRLELGFAAGSGLVLAQISADPPRTRATVTLIGPPADAPV